MVPRRPRRSRQPRARPLLRRDRLHRPARRRAARGAETGTAPLVPVEPRIVVEAFHRRRIARDRRGRRTRSVPGRSATAGELNAILQPLTPSVAAVADDPIDPTRYDRRPDPTRQTTT